MSPPDRRHDQQRLRPPSVGHCVCQQLTIEYCNDTFADLFGYPEPAQLFGQSLPALVAPPDRDRVEAQLRELTAVDRETVATAATGLTRDDDRVPVDLFAGSVQIGDAPVLVASVSGRQSPPTGVPGGPTTGVQHGDPTASFLAELAHDLRNPLTVATGHLELLRQQATLSPAEKKHTEGLTRALTRMETLLEEALSAVGSEPSIERRPVELAELAADAWEIVPSDDATLTIELSRTIAADPRKLLRLFENLFRNAVQHGGSDVRVEVGELAAGTGLYVADDGPGIPPADRDRVFDPEYTTHDAGTGLGLAIVSKVVAAHGWQLDLTESTAGGARFEIYTDEDPRPVSAT